MQTYLVNLNADPKKSFRCSKAAGSVDLDIDKKLNHRLEITADIDSPYSVGLIIGASGSGKTTLAREMFGDDFDEFDIDYSECVMDQMDQNLSYDECAKMLSSVGLSSIPCWIKPLSVLSNGQKSRAEIAIKLSNAKGDKILVVDEWTSVVDRTVAKAMSQSVQNFARKFNKQIVLVSCHYDIEQWLNPCWVIDCNEQKYVDRRSLWQDFKRTEQIEFQVRKLATGKSWRMFSKYHYLSDNLARGLAFYYGLFIGDKQVGFQAFSEYVPWRDKRKKRMLHSNRTVIHPDYVGFGLGMILINETSKLVSNDYLIFGKFSSVAIFKAMSKSKEWILKDTGFTTSKPAGTINPQRANSMRKKVKWWSFKYIGEKARRPTNEKNEINKKSD